MNLDEKRVWPLAGSTTCYCGGRALLPDDSSSASIHVGTSLHTVQIGITTKDPLHSDIRVSYNSVPQQSTHSSASLCVGYDVCKEGYEVIALLSDPQYEQEHEDENVASLSAASIAALSGSPAALGPNNSESDTMTVTSTATSATASTTTTPNPVPKSIDENSTTDTPLSVSRQASNAPSNPAINPNGSENEDKNIKKSYSSQVRLVLQKQHMGGEPELLASWHSEDFRPLAVKVGTLRLLQEETYRESWVPVVWCGNSNSNRLYCFIYHENEDDGNNPDPTFESLDIEKRDAFSFGTPITAIDFVQVNESNQEQSSCLAVSCQDGTVRLLQFSAVSVSSHKDLSKGNHWVNLQQKTITVDGPIVCNHLIPNHSSLTVIVGSLCGYVFSMTRRTAGIDPSEDHESSETTQDRDDRSWRWDEPAMVAEAFWNSHLSSPDLVLAVHGFGDYVAIGTHSGRCFLYQSQKRTNESNEDAFDCVWQCRLPYSIHEICCWFDAVGFIQMVVTTRRSIHFFQQLATKNTRATLTSAIYKPQLAKDRLSKLLELI